MAAGDRDSLSAKSNPGGSQPAAIAPEREPHWALQVCALGLVVAGIYGVGMRSVPLRGEESRWARVAQEMLDSGDWITPRQQGQVFPDRPPLNSWCIAVVSLIVGDTSPLAVRLPTVLATALTAVLVALYARNFVGLAAALCAGLIYVAFPQILQLGRFAESDALMTLFIAASLFVWHSGLMRGWPPWAFWSAGYGFAALAALTKGPQGPIYFVGATCLYLLVRRDWRRLFCWGHLAGAALMVAIIAAWQIPFSLRFGIETSLKAWSEEGELAGRLAEAGSGRLFRHLAAFPFEILVVALPWAVFATPLITRKFWRSAGARRDGAIFLLVVMFVVLAPCWIVPSAKVRYVMALFPAAACLLALAADYTLEIAQGLPRLRSWNWFHGVTAGFMVMLAGVAIYFACAAPRPADAVVPEVAAGWLTSAPLPGRAVLGGFAAVALAAALTAALSIGRRLRRLPWLVLPAAVVLCAGYDGPILDYLIVASPNTPAAVAKIKAEIPPEARLASFGPVYHLFTYAYRDPIELRTWPAADAAAEEMPEYFCFMQAAGKTHAIPVPWEKVGEVVCDRYRMSAPREVVVVGRRIRPPRMANMYGGHK